MDYLWTLPIVGAFVGYCTNWLAVRMLFHPHEPVKVLFLTIHGLIPRRRKVFAECVADMVHRELFGVEDIKAALADPRIVERLKLEIDLRLNEMISAGDVLPDFILPMLTAQIRERVAGIFIDSLQGTLSSMDDVMDIKAIVEDRINRFDVRHITDIVHYVSSTGFKWIEILGAVLGAVIGSVQWLLIAVLI